MINGQIYADNQQTSAHKSKPSATAKDGQNTHWPSQWSHQDLTCKRQPGLLQQPREEQRYLKGSESLFWRGQDLVGLSKPHGSTGST